MRQGNDIGAQYRSIICTYNDKQAIDAGISKKHYQEKLLSKGFGTVTTEIITAPVFHYAEDYHQQYLAKNPNGYCGLGGLDVPFK